MQKVAILLSLLIATSIAKKVYFCEVPVDVDAATPDAKIHMRGVGYDWNNINALSLGSFYAPSADVEGRTVVAGDVDITSYSFGAVLQTSGVAHLDNALPLSLVVGGDLSWKVGGSLGPQADSGGFGPAEGYAVAGASKVDATVGVGAAESGVNAQDFTDATAYFKAISAALAGQTATGSCTRLWSKTTCSCSDSSSTATQFFDVNPADMKDATEFVVANCNSAAALVFNIRGTATVQFHGDSLNVVDSQFPKVIYNVIGARTVQVETEVRGSILAVDAVYNQPGTGVVKGLVVAGTMKRVHQINLIRCAPPADVVPNDCTGFEKDCAGINFQFGSFVDYNVIAFKDFNAASGDIEGRLAVGGNANLGNGYSIGAKLSTVNNIPDNHATYSLVVGGDLVWGSGELYPLGTGYLAVGAREDAFVSGEATVPSNLADRIHNDNTDLASSFAAAKGCYKSFSDSMAAQPTNVKKSIFWSGLFVTCDDAAASNYFIDLTAAELTQYTYVVTDNCNFQANWVLNIQSDVTRVEFTGATFPTIPGGTVCNVQGAREVYVHDTLLGCHLLAPEAHLNQASGVIVGKVVVDNVDASLQINRETTCPVPVTVLKPVVIAADAPAGSMTVRIEGAKDFRVGDEIFCGAIQAIDGDLVYCSFPLNQDVKAGSNQGNLKVLSSSGRPHVANKDMTNSASTMSIAFALLAIVALFL